MVVRRLLPASMCTGCGAFPLNPSSLSSAVNCQCVEYEPLYRPWPVFVQGDQGTRRTIGSTGTLQQGLSAFVFRPSV